VSVALGLLGYGTLLALAGPRLLAALPSATRAPRLGVLLWQVAALSVVASWAVGALALALPVAPVHGLGHLLASCLAAVHDATSSPRQGWVKAVGLAASAAVSMRACWCVAGGAVAGYRRRLRHARLLQMIARPAPELGAVVVDHSAPVAYCLPGRVRQTVVSRGALEVLSPVELAAVLAHERAHLRARHHLALAPMQALARAFPRVPVLQAAARELPGLLEMCADDAAARRHGPAAVAGALRSLSSMPSPAGSLAAAGRGAEARIGRLLAPPRRRLAARAIFGAAVMLLATGPLLAAVAPVLAAAVDHLGYCPVPLVS